MSLPMDLLEDWGGHYKTVPYWRCQPYFRKVDGVKQNTALLKMAGENELIKSIPQANNKRQLEDEPMMMRAIVNSKSKQH